MPRATPPSSLGDFHQTGLGTLAGSGAVRESVKDYAL